MPERILIVDDHGILRAGLRALLNAETDFTVVGEVPDGETALQIAGQLKPDIVLMDISLPGLGGIETTRQLVKLLPEARVLMLTVHEDKELVRESIKAGAAGYILKRAVESELINAIRAVAKGDLYLHPAMTRALLPDLLPAQEHHSHPAETITAREIEVLKLIVQGHTNRQIAERLNLSIRTVETHRGNIMAKLNLRSRVELVHYAAEHGLLEPIAQELWNKEGSKKPQE